MGLSSQDLAAGGLGAAGAVVLTWVAHAAPVDATKCRAEDSRGAAEVTVADRETEAANVGKAASRGASAPSPSRPAPAASAPITADDEPTVHACATGRDWAACGFLEPGEAELAEMARCGVVRIDFPEALYSPNREVEVPESWSTTLGLSDAEREAVRDATQKFRDALWADFAEMAEGTDLDAAWIAQSDLLSVAGRLEEQDLEADEAAFVRVAEERAGVESEAAAEGMQDRLAERLAGLGDEFEGALAARLGVERARELRVASDGWEVRMRVRKRCLEEDR